MKETYFTQKMKLMEAFEKPMTMLQAANKTGIERAHICRFIADWKRKGRIAITKLGMCPISGASNVQFLQLT